MARTASVKIVRVPQPVVVRGGPIAKRGRAALKRAGRRVSTVVSDNKHLMGAVIGAGGFALLRRYAPSVVATLTIGPLPPELVAGVACVLLGKSNRQVRHAGTGLVSLGVAQLVGAFGGTTAGY